MDATRDGSWDEFADGIAALEHLISQSAGKTVRGTVTRTAARTLAQKFLRETRPHLLDLGIPETTVSQFDRPIKVLLGISQAIEERSIYAGVLAKLRRLHTEMAPQREMRMGARGVAVISLVERRIIRTLDQILPAASLSYQQVLVDLTNPRYSFRGVAHELREVLRETLDHLAPDAEVMAERGFQLEDKLSRPSQRQKAAYILRKRRTPRDSSQAPDAVNAVEEIEARIARSTYTRGAKSAHSSTGETEVRHMKMYADAVLAELLEVHGERTSQ